MKALTIKQPFASAILLGYKDVENRTWQTPFRGRILIHTGQTSAGPEAFHKFGQITGISFSPESFAHGVILGTVELADIITDSRSRWSIPGQYHWLLKDPQPFPRPIPASGHLGLWNIHI